MPTLAEAHRVLILERHLKTPANLAKEEGSPDSRVQGLSPDMPVLPSEHVKGRALGIAIGRFALQNGLHIVEFHASDTERARVTRELQLAQIALSYPDFPPFTVVEPTKALWEHRKGDAALGGLEGMLRTRAYPPDGKAPDDPNFRHGSVASGGETPNEAGRRWVSDWLNPVLAQDNFQPCENPTDAIPTIAAIGHNLVTDRGLGKWLDEDEDRPVSTRKYKIGNGNALVVAQFNSGWSVHDELIIPTVLDLEIAEAAMAAESH